MDKAESQPGDRYLLREELARRRRIKKMAPKVRQVVEELQENRREQLQYLLPRKLVKSAIKDHERLQKMADESEKRAAKPKRAKSGTSTKRTGRLRVSKAARKTKRSRKS